MTTESKITTDHQEIRKWVESRDGHPSRVKGTGSADDPGGILRIDFPGYSGEHSLEPISWEMFFEEFDQRGLAFLYQDKTAHGKDSRFNKLIARSDHKH